MTTNLIDRQHASCAMADLRHTNLGADEAVTIAIPVGAVLLRMVTLTTTAFNSVTSDALTVTDGTTTFVNAVDLQSTGSETVANLPKFYPSGGTLTCTITGVGTAATAGRVLIMPEYLIVGNGNAGIYAG